MLLTLLAGATLATLPVQLVDTTITARRGMRLDLQHREGSIEVTTWQRDAVHIETARTNSGSFSVEEMGSVLRVRAARGRWRSRDRGDRRRFEWDDDDPRIDFRITVPAYVHLTLRGTEVDIRVSGTQGDITAETIEGIIQIRGGNGLIAVHSVEDLVRVEDATGRVEASSGEGDVIIRRVSGQVAAESVDGDVRLIEIDSRNASAETVDGDVFYDGTIYDNGRYRLSTHDGDVVLTVPESTNATVDVTSFDGDFETEFPITLRESNRKRFSFVLGNGAAEVQLEAFDGQIYLRRR